MKRLLVSILALLFLAAPVAANVGLLQFAASLSGQYFVSNSGSDLNPGTQASPWQTIAHVNSFKFLSSACVNFNGGQTFTGGVNAVGLGCITSYGAGQATISSGNSAACYTSTNVPGVSVTNVICTGGGNLTNTTAGISIINSQAGNTKLTGPTISGVTVSGYGYNGISVQGSNGSSGFNGVTIANNIVHDVTGNSTDSFGTSCIMVFSKTNYGSGTTTPAHINVSITSNTVYNCTGTTAGPPTNWTGSGIFTSEASNVTIGGCSTCGNVAHDFGSLGGGTFEPGGIWAAEGSNILISYNEVFKGQTGSGGGHADGGGLDQGVINSTFEKNWYHDNAGLGIIIEEAFDGTCCTQWGNNIYRYNLFQNNCTAGDNTNCAEIFYHFEANATGPVYVYNNTIVNQIGGNAFGDNAAATATITGNNWNNLLLVNNAGKLLNFTNVTGKIFQGNDYYTYGTTASFTWNGTTYSNASVATAFASWQTATGQEKIAGVNVGLTSNPQIYVPGGGFQNNGYVPTNLMAYNLQSGSPMIGAGLNLQTQFGVNPGATDYYGAAISTATLSVGAANGDFTSFAASCTAATNYLARVSSFAKADNVNYNSILCGLNSDGILSAIDVFYIPAAPNAAAYKLNLISSSFGLVEHGTVTFTAQHGVAGNGSTGYLDTGWIPSRDGVNYTLSSVTHLGYSQTNGRPDTEPFYGNQTSTANGETTSFPGTGGWYADANDESGSTDAADTFSNGLFLLRRTASPLVTAGCPAGCYLNQYINGISKHGTQNGPVAVPNQNMILLAFNNGNGTGCPSACVIVPNPFGAAQLSAVLFGSGSIDPLGVSLRINSFMQAYGINTY